MIISTLFLKMAQSRLKFILVLFCFVKSGICEETYVAGFNEGAASCKDFDNKDFNADNMKLAPMSGTEDDDGAGMCIEGYMEMAINVEEGYNLNLEILKESGDTAAAPEVMWSCAMDLCKSIEDKDAPWAPLFDAMGITGCPIEKGRYKVNNMTLNLDFCQDVLNHNYVGDYNVVVKITDSQMNEISCHTLGICINEVEEE